MRRTNILIDVSDDVYDEVIEPMKKNKTFSKLIASLIQGYISDGYIRAYAEDTLEELKKASVSSFNKSIDSMSESLSNLGLAADELEAVSMSGRSKFSDSAKRYKGEVSESKISSSKSQEEIDALNKRIDDMQTSFNATLQSILEAVKGSSIQSGGIPQMPMMYGMPMQGYGMPQMMYGMPMQGYVPQQGGITQQQAGVQNKEESREGAEITPLTNNENTKDVKKASSFDFEPLTVEKKKVEQSSGNGLTSPSIVGSIQEEVHTTSEDDDDWDSEADDFMSSMLDGNHYSF